MPLKNNQVYCVNHPNAQMALNEGFYALTKMTKLSDGSVNFNPGSGIPVVVYICTICGNIETYAAKATSLWESVDMINK